MLVRFNNTGTIDGRDGDVYRAANIVHYVAGATYRFRVVVDVAEHRYWAYVNEIYFFGGAFRTEQNQVASLANWGSYCAGGSLQVCEVSISPHVHNINRDFWYPTIQQAIDFANNGDELLLPPGLYTGAGNRDIEGRGKSFHLRGSNPGDASVVDSTIIDCQASSTDRHRAFTLRSYQPCAVVIEGITIRNGHAPATELVNGYPAPAGGAVFCGGASLTISSCILRDNTAESSYLATGTEHVYAGALFFSGPELLVSQSRFLGNTVRASFWPVYGSSNGGAIYAESTVKSTFVDCDISDNIVYPAHSVRASGGGIYCRGSTEILNCRIAGNSAMYSEAPAYGGGVFSDGPLTMTFCTVVNNYAGFGHDMGGFGGGVHSRAGAIISRCTISGNGCGPGGGVYCLPESTSTVTESVISGNRDCGDDFGYFGGGGICGAALVQNCLIMGNRGIAHGAALEECEQVMGCTIVGNWLDWAPYTRGGVVHECKQVTNCILWGNDSPIYQSDTQISSSPIYSYNSSGDPLFETIESGTWTAPADFGGIWNFCTVLRDDTKEWEENSLVGRMIKTDAQRGSGAYIISNTGTTVTVSGDASFVNAGTAYAICDVRLSSESPCVNGSNPRADYSGQYDPDGNPRVHSCLPDIGAYESRHVRYAPADFDQDCYVSTADLNHLAGCALGPAVPQHDTACSRANLSADPFGTVDQTDFAVLQRCWTGDVHPASPLCAE